MSTYTDLQNKVKETINVGYRDRQTTQEVKFRNERNEYWGTFKGTVQVDEVAVNGGRLSGVEIWNSSLCGNVFLPNGANLTIFGEQLGDLSTTVETINDTTIPELGSRITNINGKIDTEIATRTANGIGLSAKVNSIETNAKGELSAISVVILTSIAQTECTLSTKLSTELSAQDCSISTFLDNQIQDLSTTCHIQLSNQIDDNFDDLSNAISTERVIRYNEISGERAVRISEDAIIKGDLTTESTIRETGDIKLSGLIASTSVDLSNALTSYAKQNQEDLNVEHLSMLSTILTEKHYAIGDGVTILKTYPYTLEDYTVNVIDAVVIDNFVQLGGKTVGQITTDDSGITVKFYDLKNAPQLEVAINPYSSFYFGNTGSQVVQAKGNFTITYDRQNNRFLIADAPEKYVAIYDKVSGRKIGRVDKYLLDQTTSALISGNVTIVADSSSELSIFNSINDVFISQTSNVIDQPATGIQAILDKPEFKTFTLRKGVSTTHYAQVSTDAGYNVAEIHQGNVVYESGILSKIGVTIDSGIVNLTQTNNFTSDFGVSSILCANTALSTFTRLEKHAHYQYGYYLSDDVTHEKRCYGHVIMVDENAEIMPATYEQVSVLVESPSISKICGMWLLTRDHTSGIPVWRSEVRTFDPSYDNLQLHFYGTVLKAIGNIDGQPINVTYAVDVEDKSIYNTSTWLQNAWTSTPTDWNTYDHEYSIDAGHWTATINPQEVEPSPETFILDKVIESASESIKFVMPPQISDGKHSREMYLACKFTATPEAKKLEFFEQDGTPITYFNHDHVDFYIPTGKWNSICINEIRSHEFQVIDVGANDYKHIIDLIKQAIENEISARISSDWALCAEISADLSSKYNDLNAKISVNSSDIDKLSSAIWSDGELSDKVEFLLSVDKETVNYKGIIPTYYPTHPEIPTDWQLCELISSNVGIGGKIDVKLGDLFKVNQNLSAIYDTRKTVSTSFGKLDFFIANKSIEHLTSITLDDIDIFRNSEAEVESLSVKLQQQITTNATNINILSTYTHNKLELSVSEISAQTSILCTEISTAIGSLSTNLSTDINNICTDISTDIKAKYNELTGESSRLCSAISGKIDTLCAEISTDIKTKYNELTSCTLSDQVVIKDLSAHYNKTFEKDYHVDVFGQDVSVDLLKMTDESLTGKKYTLHLSAGTLVMIPIE